MEWVEKAGRTLEEAKELALGELGVAEGDAELVVLAEPRTGLFGRLRGEARVRARVRPAEPRERRTRRTREQRRRTPDAGPRERQERSGGADRSTTRDRSSSPSGGKSPETGATPGGTGTRKRRRRRGGRGSHGGAGSSGASTGTASTDAAGTPVGDGGERESMVAQARTDARGGGSSKAKEAAVSDGVTLEEQSAVAGAFIEELLERYGLDATVTTRTVDEETLEVAVHGEGLGLLVGRKGAALAALQDVTRSVVQARFPGHVDRVLVDVAGYRERRVAALQKFAAQIAAEVLESGSEQALEPMTPADRKVVHDTVATIEGVASSSDGEEPGRFVVISPAS